MTFPYLNVVVIASTVILIQLVQHANDVAVIMGIGVTGLATIAAHFFEFIRRFRN